MGHNCLYCGFCHEEEKNGEKTYYCMDLDVEIDPYDEAPCSEENYNS